MAFEEYSYLWDGSEPGWVVQVTYQQVGAVTLVFDEGGPTAKELIAVRRLLDEFRDLPLQETRRRFAGRRRVPLDESYGKGIRNLEDEARRLGLRTEVAGDTQIHRMLVNERSNQALLIEDDAKADAVAREALARGVPERPVEAD